MHVIIDCLGDMKAIEDGVLRVSKQLLLLNGKTVIERCLEKIAHKSVKETTIVTTICNTDLIYFCNNVFKNTSTKVNVSVLSAGQTIESFIQRKIKGSAILIDGSSVFLEPTEDIFSYFDDRCTLKIGLSWSASRRFVLDFEESTKDLININRAEGVLTHGWDLAGITHFSGEAIALLNKGFSIQKLPRAATSCKVFCLKEPVLRLDNNQSIANLKSLVRS